MKINRRAIVNNLKNPRSGWQTAVLVFIAASAYFYRAFAYIRNPQLFGEDGELWLSDGYNHGIDLLFQPIAGFLHVPERLFGFVVAHLPLHFAPFIFNATAWLIFILTVYYLFSVRTKILNNNFERISLLIALCLIANVDEFFFNFSNSIFLLGIVGVLIIIGKRPRYLAAVIGEKVLFLLACFTLPFAWFFLPVALIEKFKYKQKGSFFLWASLIASIAQLIAFLSSHANRASIPIQALLSEHTMVEIYNQILMPAVRFARIDMPTLAANVPVPRFLLGVLFLSMAALLVATIVVLKKNNKNVWYLLFLLGAMTLASLKSPQLLGNPVEVIHFLSVASGGDRYFIYGIIAVQIIFVKIAYITLKEKVRYISMAVFIMFGLFASFYYREFYVEKNFTDYSRVYHHKITQLESGAVYKVEIPINPKDTLGWSVKLERK